MSGSRRVAGTGRSEGWVGRWNPARFHARQFLVTVAFLLLTALIFEGMLIAWKFSPSLGQKLDRASLELTSRLGKHVSKQLQQAETSSTSDVSPLSHALFSLVINLGLPKTGSTTLHHFFQCGGFSSSHWFCGGKKKCAECIRANLKNGSAPLEGCDNFAVFTQIDDPSLLPSSCYFPQVDALQALYRHYPHALFLLPRRNSGAWTRSVRKWSMMGSLMSDRMRACTFQTRGKIEDLHQFYHEHLEAVRAFARVNPKMKILEYDVEQPKPLFDHFKNISQHCWGHWNINFNASLQNGGGTFPKLLHYTWPNKNLGFDSEHPYEQNKTKHWASKIKQLNSAWSVKIWTDNDL